MLVNLCQSFLVTANAHNKIVTMVVSVHNTFWVKEGTIVKTF